MLEEPIRAEDETVTRPRQPTVKIDLNEKIAADRSGEEVTVRMAGHPLGVDKTKTTHLLHHRVIPGQLPKDTLAEEQRLRVPDVPQPEAAVAEYKRGQCGLHP